jgi:hypothetical protein
MMPSLATRSILLLGARMFRSVIHYAGMTDMSGVGIVSAFTGSHLENLGGIVYDPPAAGGVIRPAKGSK